MQTPQFQMRRLKKQLADERNNRDELELELAENRKLLTEKGRYLARWRMCVDGQHSGFSSGKVLGLSEVWPFCLLCCLLCWPGSRAPPWAHWLTRGSWCYPCPPPSFPGPAAPSLLPPRSSPHPGLSPLLSSGADAQIAMMQQRIDRLTQLNEKQAASPLEPRERRSCVARTRGTVLLLSFCARHSGHVLFPHWPPLSQPHCAAA